MQSKKLLSLLLALAMLFSLSVTASADETDKALEGQIVILHTNDVHGGIEGYARVAALKAMYEAAGATVFVMDAGDFSQGETSVSVSEGATAIELMNMVGYDLAAPGNHEFDYGYENLAKLVKAANFPVLAANINYEGKVAFGDNTVLTTEDGVKIGVFGLDTPETATKAHPGKIKGVTFTGGEEMYAIAQAQVDKLTADGCDYIICVGHLGIDDESAANGNRSIDMLAKVTGIDVLIDGHSHSTLEQVTAATKGTGKVGETLVTSTGTKLANIGVVTIKGDEITVASVDSATVPVAEDDAIAARAKAIRDEIEAEYGATFAATEVKLNGDRDPGNRTEETNLGDLIADAMVWYATKDGEDLGVPAENVIAITNGGGIRASVEAGDITKNDINTVLPFGNTVAYVTVTGEALLEVLEASTYCTPTAVGGFPQVSGVNFTINTGNTFDQGELYTDTTYYAPASINRVTINSVNGQDFDAKASYAVVTNDFLAAGGDTYYAFTTSDSIVDTGTPLDVALMEYITEELDGTVSAEKYAEPAGRITITDEATAAPEQPAAPAAVTFSDVSESNWHYEFVMKMAEEGVVNGYADGTFKPSNSLTWGEALKMVVSYVTGEEKAPVEGGTWASGYIAYVQDNGIWDGEISQNATITREEMCVVLAKMLKVAASEKDSIFPDTDNAYVMALVELGIIDGIDGSFQPDGPLTRAQVCKILATIPEDLETAGDQAEAPAEEETAEPVEDENAEKAA